MLSDANWTRQQSRTRWFAARIRLRAGFLSAQKGKHPAAWWTCRAGEELNVVLDTRIYSPLTAHRQNR